MKALNWVFRGEPRNARLLTEVSESFVSHFFGNGVLDDKEAFLKTESYTVYRAQTADLESMNPDYASGMGELDLSKGWLPILFFARFVQRIEEVNGETVSDYSARFVNEQGKMVRLSSWSDAQAELLRLGFSEAEIAVAKAAAETIGLVERVVYLDELDFGESSLFF